ncbi:PstS family phosphate ABC transporter substrate-binding protein [Vibrio alfacsensis]|uniref:PstS family phosphate ABC transporter substrate-binding protein n=1 Tax=Vibrio alfacsensis TaxID=1074311 RepID=UPI00406875B8
MTFSFLSPVTQAGEIVIGGTGNGLGTMKKLADAYTKKNPDIDITVLPSLGSSGGIRAVNAGAIHLGIAGRPLKSNEKSEFLSAIELSRTPAVLVVSENTFATDITRQQLADIYSDRTKVWPDGVTIRPLVRSSSDGATRLLTNLSPDMAQAMATAQKNMTYPFGDNDQHSAETLEKQHGAIGLLSLALIRTEERNLKPLSLDGVAATPENLASGKYPMYYSFYLVTQENADPAVADFIEFIGSEAGHDILNQYGHLPIL